ncbi:hypothetical protein OG539_33205 [Actinacidiphila glaucinigra]|uniref:hypothetical protein n=1 Tax=Actinacidiphila glaucinigra TaxID=235986 RepID=UPI0032528FBF
MAEEVSSAALQPVEVLGVDEVRRGRTQRRPDLDTRHWEPIAGQWHTGFVDAASNQGLLGRVEGHAAAKARSVGISTGSIARPQSAAPPDRTMCSVAGAK